jgi:hypothetical protein
LTAHGFIGCDKFGDGRRDVNSPGESGNKIDTAVERDRKISGLGVPLADFRRRILFCIPQHLPKKLEVRRYRRHG